MKLRRPLFAAAVVVSLSGLTFLSSVAAHAQAATGKRRVQNDANLEAFKSVGPTPDALSKFEALNEKYKADSKNITATTTDRKELGRQRMELTAKFRSDVDALLTPEQVTKFHQAIVSLPIMRNLTLKLMLTPDQTTKVESIVNDYALKTDGMKGKERRAATDETKAKIREVLTPDQQVKLDAMNNLAGGGGRRTAPPTPGAPGAPTAPGAPGAPAAP